MIPKALEDLILAGKARHEIFSHIAGGYNAWILPPDHVAVIYNVKIFPFIDFDRDYNQHGFFQFTLRSQQSRDTFPFKFVMVFDSQGERHPREGILSFDCYSIHRGKMVMDLRKYPPPSTWNSVTAPVRDDGSSEQQPYGFAGLTVPESIDFVAGAPFTYQTDPAPSMTAGANNVKPEPPALGGTQLESFLKGLNVTEDSIPIIHLSAVITDSANFNKIKA